MQPYWPNIINAVGFSCLTFDIYEMDKCTVRRFQRFWLIEVLSRLTSDLSEYVDQCK